MQTEIVKPTRRVVRTTLIAPAFREAVKASRTRIRQDRLAGIGGFAPSTFCRHLQRKERVRIGHPGIIAIARVLGFPEAECFDTEEQAPR